VHGNAESRAIAKYIVDKYKLTFLVGTTPKEKATINKWVESESQNFYPAVLPLVRDAFYARMQNRPVDEKIKATGKDNLGKVFDEYKAQLFVDEKIKATSKENLGKVFDVYEAQLSKHKYLAGDSYTLADVFHTPFLFLVNTMDAFAGAFDNRPHVKVWVDDITSNPAFLKTRKLDWDNATPF